MRVDIYDRTAKRKPYIRSTHDTTKMTRKRQTKQGGNQKQNSDAKALMEDTKIFKHLNNK